MKHQMGLYKEYMEVIEDGNKIVEVRLNDEKRKEIKVGDLIEFIEVPTNYKTITVRVVALRKYDTFEKMYSDISYKDFGCEGWTLEQLVEGTYEIYSPELEKKYGALAINIEKL